MGKDVPAIVSERQFSHFRGKPVGLHSRFVELPAPISKRSNNLLECSVAREHRASFPHSHMVACVKTAGSNIAKGSRVLSLIPRSYGITIVFNKPYLVFFCYTQKLSKVRGVAKTVSHKNCLCF